jgi:hypothetical protein
LAGQQRILDRYDTTTGKDKNSAFRDLATHAKDNRDLINQIAAHAPRPTSDTRNQH